MPEISVLMSVYNGERFLRPAIESILNQSFNDFEFVIINDGSTDKSLDIIQSYANKDKRIQLINQENKGLIAALNTGLEQAKSPLIARMDADDIAYSERLSIQKQYMDTHPDIGVLGSAITPIDENNHPSKVLYYPQKNKIDDYIYNNGSPLAHPAVIMRRNLVLKEGGYHENFKHAEDYDLWLRLHKVTGIDNIKEPLLYYRQHTQKISLQYVEQQARSSIVARYIHKNNLKSDSLDFQNIMNNTSADEKNKFEWEIIDIIASSLLLSSQSGDIKDYQDKIPKVAMNQSKPVAVRVYLKHALFFLKNKDYKGFAQYIGKSFCISPLNTLALLTNKIFK